MRTFDHERLEVYGLVRAYNREITGLLRRIDRGTLGKHVEQLRQAGASIGLNLAEGTGEFAPREKARFYRMARRSAAESAAGLDYLVDAGAADETRIAAPKELLRRITSILVILIRQNSAPRRPRD